MGTPLTGRTIAGSYKDLLQVSNSNAGVDATLRDVEDGEGTASALKVSTTQVQVASSITVAAAAISLAAAGSGAGTTFTITGSDAGSGNSNGGAINITCGAPAGSGNRGNLNVTASEAIFSGSLLVGSTGFGWYKYSSIGILTSIGGSLQEFLFSNARRYVSGLVIGWSSSSNDPTAIADTGLARASAGVVKVSDASTGSGGISSVAKTNSLGSSNLDNYASGVGLHQRWTAGAAIDVTGMVAGQDGEFRHIWNHGSNTITLKNDVTSTAANRWLTTTGADLALAANKCALAIYDATTQRWRVSLLP